MRRGTEKGMDGEKRAQGRPWVLRAGAQTGERCRWAVELTKPERKKKAKERGSTGTAAGRLRVDQHQQ